jgi:hypothetical protein
VTHIAHTGGVLTNQRRLANRFDLSTVGSATNVLVVTISEHICICDLSCRLTTGASHCPWVWNCVGAGNHRQFVLFITMLVFGILFFDYLSFNCK